MIDHNIQEINNAGYALSAIARILKDINVAKCSEEPSPEWYESDNVIGGLYAAVEVLSDTIQGQAEILEKQAKQAEGKAD